MTTIPPVVDADLAERLVREQHPDLLGEIRLEASGWDNAVFRLGESLTVRLPRRPEAVPLVLSEQRWLPTLAAVVTVPVSVPVRAGHPSPVFPWPWSIMRWIDGESALDHIPADLADVAPALAEFATELHRPAPREAPANPVRGVPLATRSRAVAERIAGGLVPRGAELAAVWRSLDDVPPWEGEPIWLHGDPHPGNLLVRRVPSGLPERAANPKPTTMDVRLDLAGVIDFGDLTSGDPATDLAIAWTTLDPAGRAAFRERLDELDPPDTATWARARGWALVIGTALLASPHADVRLVGVGEHAVAQVLLGE